MELITEITKRDIYELFRDGITDHDLLDIQIQYPYYGRLGEIEFLERLYNLKKMKSHDSRYSNAYEDIVQHTINNDDYPYCWVFTDDRFQLNKGSDDIFLRFLCEVFHPLVRNEQLEWRRFFYEINKLIRVDGYELYPKEKISGRDVYSWRLCGVNVVDKMSSEILVDLVDEFKSGLIAKATDGSIDEAEYKRCRDILIKVPELKGHIPAFIKSNRTAQDFRRYMQGLDQHYAGRREIIIQQMNDLAERLERGMDSDPFMELQEYKRLERLGRGGFGTVYRYHNDCLDMDFAVKIYDPIFASSEEQIEGERRFFREAKMMFGLNSVHIARIYDAGRIESKPYIRMELIDGYNLNTLHEQEGNLEFTRSSIVILHILAGLKNAHERGIIHRDLRPSNVMFSKPERMFKIIDFGVSAFLDTDNHTKLTKTGEHIAGGAYIDPLLQDNPKLRDPRVDIYSVGAIWYFLLCGRAPSGSDMRDYLKRSNMELKDWQIDLVMKCLSGNINDRFNTCEELSINIKEKVQFKK